MSSNEPTPEQPVSWRAVHEDVAVRSADGTSVGKVYDLLGSKEEDIFHGVVVALREGGRRVFVAADDIGLLTETHVDLALTAAEVAALPTHTDERAYSLNWTGILRKRMGWVEEKDR
jgi:hypothetical protein